MTDELVARLVAESQARFPDGCCARWAAGHLCPYHEGYRDGVARSHLAEAFLAYAWEWADSGCENHFALWDVARCVQAGTITVEALTRLRSELIGWRNTEGRR